MLQPLGDSQAGTSSSTRLGTLSISYHYGSPKGVISLKEKTESKDPGNSEDPRSSLAKWANQNDEWIRRIVRYVLATNAEVSAEERTRAHKLFLEEKGFEERTLPAEPQVSLSKQAAVQPKPFYLTSMSSVRGVNALVENVTIDFAPGMTLFFGENGSGKTGYARILKCVAGSRSADDILPDINQDDNPSSPYAEIGFRIGDDQSSHEWTGDQSKSPFTLMSVFDTPSVHFHTDAEVGYTYRPSSLAVFDRVTRAVQYIADRIDSELATLGTDNTDLLRRFDNGSSIYPHIAKLGASTDLSVLQKMATLPDGTTDRMAELELANAQLTAGTIGQEIAVLAGLKKVLAEALSFTSVVQKLEVQEYNLAVTRLSGLREDQATLRESLLAADLPAPPDKTFEAFIHSGRAYRRHLESIGAHDDTRCLYCRQALGHDAVQLVARYGAYLESQIAEDIQNQETAAERLVQPLQDSSLASVQAYIEEVDGDIYNGPGIAHTGLGPRGVAEGTEEGVE